METVEAQIEFLRRSLEGPKQCALHVSFLRHVDEAVIHGEARVALFCATSMLFSLTPYEQTLPEVRD